jgi:threonine aldolase
MRQAGILAAAGIIALETMIPRLAEDHDNARRLAKHLSQIPGILLDPQRIQTNIVFFELEDSIPPAKLLSALANRYIKIGAAGGQKFRAVTHYGIEAQDIDTVGSAIREALRRLSR